MKPATVGQFRQQSALTDTDTPLVLVTKNEALRALLRGLRIVSVYQDTTDAEGNWSGGTFKIEVDES